MKIPLFFIVLFIISSQFGCSSAKLNANSRFDLKFPNFKINEPFQQKVFADEAEIDVDFQIPESLDTNLKTVLEQPPPTFSFIFPCEKVETAKSNCGDESLTARLPDETTMFLREYWKEALTFRYKTNINIKELNAKTFKEISDLHSSASSEFEESISKINLNAPNGVRNISKREAEQLLIFINLAASEMIEKAKNTSENRI